MSKLNCNELLILADRELKVCETAEEAFPEEYAVSAAAFHIHQAIERLMQGLIIEKGAEPDHTHNIARLTSQCQRNGIDIPEELYDISDTLTLWELLSRYDPYMEFSQRKYDVAKKVYGILYDKLYNELNSLS